MNTVPTYWLVKDKPVETTSSSISAEMISAWVDFFSQQDENKKLQIAQEDIDKASERVAESVANIDWVEEDDE